MKKMFITAIFILMMVFCFLPLVQAADVIAIPSSLNTRVIALEVSATTLAGRIATVELSLVAQADTNVTTTATLYTPRFVGDALLGGAGAGTNGVWIAKGATSNDWVAIKP
ncbi:MAG: hypothetical protein NT011_13495 [Kiritimatiellaeota bacterium]|nr:hypothetical protein [Kiritimatiellota bacterium]